MKNGTPGPWRYSSPQGAFGHEVVGLEGRVVCMMQHHPARREQAKTDASRIVAAVNACEGISTEALEQGVISDLMKTLKILIEMDAAEVFVKEPWEETFATARALLFKAKGD